MEGKPEDTETQVAPPSSVFITVPASPNYTITIRIKIYIEEQSCKFEKISR